MQTEVTKLAHECGATYYSPAPMRAVRGLSFTYEQLESFALRLQSEQKQCLHQIQEPAPVLAAQTTDSVLNVSSAAPQAAPAAVAVPDERAAFEKWAALHYQGVKLERSGAAYRYALANEWWPAWQARAALAATPAADAPAWDGKLPERLQIALNALRMECPAADIGGLEFEVRRTFEALETSRATAQRMFGAARDRLAEIDAMPFDPFAAAAPVVLPELSVAVSELMRLVEMASIQRASTAVLIYTEQPKELTDKSSAQEQETVKLIESTLRALLATATGLPAQAVEQAPVLYVSKGQLDNHRDPDGPESFNAGRYLPARITPAGKFTTPLFAAPQAQADARDALPEIKDMQNSPQHLNLNDRAFWVLGWNECRDSVRDTHRAAIAAAKGE